MADIQTGPLVVVPTHNKFASLQIDVAGPETSTHVNKPTKRKKRKAEDRSPPTTAPKSRRDESEPLDLDMDGINNDDPNDPPETDDTGNIINTNIDPDTGNQPDTQPNPDNKWHIVIHTTNSVALDTSKLDSAIEKFCKNVQILDSRITRSKRSVFYQTGNPIADFNSMYKHRVSICQEMKTTLKIDPWKITTGYSKAVESDPRQVIIRDIPTDYEIDELKNRLDPELMKNVLSLGRILSSNTGKPTPIIRMVCESEDFAKTLINNGIILGNRKLKVEPANPRYNPLRCFNCCRFGHHSQECQYQQCCAICGYGHRTGECPNRNNRRQFYCVNCQSSTHRARDRHCPIFLEEAGKLRQKEEMKTRRLMNEAGVQGAPSGQVRPGTSWASIVSNTHQPEETKRNLVTIETSLKEVSTKLPEMEQNITENLRLELDSKCKGITDELRLELQMNRTGYQTLLETNKSAFENKMTNFSTYIEQRIQILLDKAIEKIETKINEALVQQKVDHMEQNSRIVYDQTKKALQFITQGTQKQGLPHAPRAQSQPRPESSGSPIVMGVPPGRQPGPGTWIQPSTMLAAAAPAPSNLPVKSSQKPKPGKPREKSQNSI